MKTYLSLLIVIFFSACSTGTDTAEYEQYEIEEFEFSIFDYHLSSSYRFKYIITESDLSVISNEGIKGVKDTVVFIKNIGEYKMLQAISNLNIDNLKEEYINPCVKDGTQITVELKKNNNIKRIHFSNYYNDEIGEIISIVNDLIPKEYAIWYNKMDLLKRMDLCK